MHIWQSLCFAAHSRNETINRSGRKGSGRRCRTKKLRKKFFGSLRGHPAEHGFPLSRTEPLNGNFELTPGVRTRHDKAILRDFAAETFREISTKVLRNVARNEVVQTQSLCEVCVEDDKLGLRLHTLGLRESGGHNHPRWKPAAQAELLREVRRSEAVDVVARCWIMY